MLIERHGCYDPAHADGNPSLLLAVEALQHSFATTAEECDVVSVREPEGATPSVLDWFDGRPHDLPAVGVEPAVAARAQIALAEGTGEQVQRGVKRASIPGLTCRCSPNCLAWLPHQAPVSDRVREAP